MTLIFREDPYARSCRTTVASVDERGIRLADTVFYPTGGGQPGDTGVLRWDGGELRIGEALKGDGPDDVVHVPEAPPSALPAPGTAVEAEIDWDRRFAHMRMHTCLHLLSAVVDGQVTGGQVGAERGRLDFNVEAGSLDKDDITARLNALVGEARAVRPRWITDEELENQPDLVKTMSVKPPRGSGRVRLLEVEGADLQACGGTHVANTSEIGPVEVVKIENKGKQNRRVVVAFKA